MPNAKQHALIGAGVGLAGWFVYCRITQREMKWEEFALAGIGGAVVGLVPDLLEPAIHPNHRSWLHSYACAGLLGYWTKRAWENPALNQLQKAQLTICSLSYLSHLIADGNTAKGLPLLC